MRDRGVLPPYPFYTLFAGKSLARMNFSWQDKTWAEFSSLEDAAPNLT